MEFDKIFKFDVIDKNRITTNKTPKENYLEKGKDVIEIESSVSSDNKNKSKVEQSDMEELNMRLSAVNENFLKPKRRMLVFLNPIGGSGKALKMWNSMFLILGTFL